MELLDSVAVTAEAGVAGDFRGAPGPRQVTILFEADWRAACAELNLTAPWTTRRANLLIAGLANPQAAGGVLAIGPVRLAITGETDPCGRMEQQISGLRGALTPAWRGGLTASVLVGGVLRVGDAAAWA
jgi:MOSC domain-containing protein YiiM